LKNGDKEMRFDYKTKFKELRNQNENLTRENSHLKSSLETMKKENSILNYKLQNYDMEYEKLKQNYIEKERSLIASLRENEQEVSS